MSTCCQNRKKREYSMISSYNRMYKIIFSLSTLATMYTLCSGCVCVFEQRIYIENELLPSSFMAILEDVQVLNARYCFFSHTFHSFFPAQLNSTQLNLFIYFLCFKKYKYRETTCSDKIRGNRKIVSRHMCVFETTKLSTTQNPVQNA